MIKVHKYHINPEKICAVYQDNDMIKIDLDSGNTLLVRPNVITLVDILVMLEPSKPPASKQIKKS